MREDNNFFFLPHLLNSSNYRKVIEGTLTLSLFSRHEETAHPITLLQVLFLIPQIKGEPKKKSTGKGFK